MRWILTVLSTLSLVLWALCCTLWVATWSRGIQFRTDPSVPQTYFYSAITVFRGTIWIDRRVARFAQLPTHRRLTQRGRLEPVPPVPKTRPVWEIKSTSVGYSSAALKRIIPGVRWSEDRYTSRLDFRAMPGVGGYFFEY